VSSPVSGPDVRTLDGMPSVIFRRNGAASTDVDVYVAAARGSDYRAVSVVQATGRTDWFRYVNSAWKPAGI
jgi:hypothetical protein